MKKDHSLTSTTAHLHIEYAIEKKSPVSSVLYIVPGALDSHTLSAKSIWPSISSAVPSPRLCICESVS